MVKLCKSNILSSAQILLHPALFILDVTSVNLNDLSLGFTFLILFYSLSHLHCSCHASVLFVALETNQFVFTVRPFTAPAWTDFLFTAVN